MMKKLRNYEREDRWMNLIEHCIVCKKIKIFNQGENLAKCNSCDIEKNTWVCLICGNIGCGRYNSAHAHDHFQSSLHNFALELQSFR